MGALSARFETTWDSVNYAPDWLTEGSATLMIDWEGTPIETSPTGAVAGETEGMGTLGLLGLLNEADGSFMLPYMWFDSERLQEGEPLAFDEVLLGGNLFYRDNSIGYFVQAAYMGGGTIQFDVLDTNDGGTVKGSVDTLLYNWQEL